MNWKSAFVSAGAAAALIVSPVTRQDRPSADPADIAIIEVDRESTGARRVRLVPAPDGNEARYLVREQLAGVEFPSDAIGRTNAITGAVVLDEQGNVVKEESKFVIDLSALQSDSRMRDNYVRRRTLETGQYGTAEFALTSISGMNMPLPTSGQFNIRVTGDLTVHGVTKPTTWEASVQAASGVYTGTAKTAFTFNDFGMQKPSVARVLSVVDTIRLEYDFKLVPQDAN